MPASVNNPGRNSSPQCGELRVLEQIESVWGLEGDAAVHSRWGVGNAGQREVSIGMAALHQSLWTLLLLLNLLVDCATPPPTQLEACSAPREPFDLPFEPGPLQKNNGYVPAICSSRLIVVNTSPAPCHSSRMPLALCPPP
jgi:hypothetical protein